MNRKQPRRPSDRVERLSIQREIGRWIRSDRVNTRHESDRLVAGVALTLVMTVGIAVLPWLSDIPWWGRLPLVALCAVFLVIAVPMVKRGAELRRRGRWLVHQYDYGFVMERTRGGIVAAPYNRVAGELMTYRESGDSSGSGTDYVMLLLTLPDGERYVMTEADLHAPDALTELAERCGFDAAQQMEHPEANEIRVANEAF